MLHEYVRVGVTPPPAELPPDEELPADAIPDEPPSREPETVKEPEVAPPEGLPEPDAGGVMVPSEDLPPHAMPGRTPKVARNDALQRSSGVRNLMVRARRNDCAARKREASANAAVPSCACDDSGVVS